MHALGNTLCPSVQPLVWSCDAMSISPRGESSKATIGGGMQNPDDPSLIPNESIEERRSRELIKLLCKFRWIGEGGSCA